MLYGFTDLVGVKSQDKTPIAALVKAKTSKILDCRPTLTVQVIYPK